MLFCLVDADQNSVFKINQEGDLVDKMLGTGRGPSEVLSISSFGHSGEDMFFVADSEQLKLVTFDKNGNNLQEKYLEYHEVPNEIIYIGEGMLLLVNTFDNSAFNVSYGEEIDDYMFRKYSMVIPVQTDPPFRGKVTPGVSICQSGILTPFRNKKGFWLLPW